MQCVIKVLGCTTDRLAVSKAVTGQVLAEHVLCMCFMGTSVANTTGCKVSASAGEHCLGTWNVCCSAASYGHVLL